VSTKILPSGISHVVLAHEDDIIKTVMDTLCAQLKLPLYAMQLCADGRELELWRPISFYHKREAASMPEPWEIELHLHIEQFPGDPSFQLPEVIKVNLNRDGERVSSSARARLFGEFKVEDDSQSTRMHDEGTGTDEAQAPLADVGSDAQDGLTASEPSEAAPHDQDPNIVHVRVVRENLSKRKPFLGGFRHRITGTLPSCDTAASSYHAHNGGRV